MGEVILAPPACLISVVPPELLLEAFYTLSAIHRVEGPRSDPPALALRAVCRYWRDIVDASPLLWDVIPLYSEGLADLFLSRAESVPIALFLRSLNRPAFNDSLSTGAFRLAFADMSRVSELSVFGWPSFGHPANWRKIQAQLEQVQMPRLHTLQIRAATIPDFLFCGTTPPNLRILCADSDGLAERGIFARGLIPLLHAPLTTLELHKIPVSDASQMIVIEALERLISLRTLHLRFADRRHRALQSQRAPRSVSLPVLEEASFDLDLRDLCTFVGVLGMPTGVNLTLSWSSSQSLPLGVALSHIGDVKGLLQAHLASLIAQGLQFGCMTSTIVHPVLGNGRRLLKLTSPTLTNPSCVPSSLPSEINIRYAYWWIERESMIRSADFINDYFAFKALLYALPGLSSSHTLHIDDNSSSPARLSSLFAIMPRVKTIIINNTCIHNILIGLSNAMRSQTLSALRTLDLRRLTLTDVAPRDVIGGPQVTAGEALVHLLDALVASGVKPISIQMRYCLVAEETVEALRARLSSGIIIG